MLHAEDQEHALNLQEPFLNLEDDKSKLTMENVENQNLKPSSLNKTKRSPCFKEEAIKNRLEIIKPAKETKKSSQTSLLTLVLNQPATSEEVSHPKKSSSEEVNPITNKKSSDSLNKNKILKMLKLISRNSSTYVITSLSFFLIYTVNIIFLGHNVRNEADQVRDINVFQIGNVYMNIFGYILCIGAMHAFDTLGSQAYNKRDYELFYDIFHSARIFSILIFLIFMLPFCFCSKYVLYILNFDVDFIILCSTFIRIALISVTLNIFHLLNGKLLQIMGHQQLVMGIYLATLAIHIVLCLFFILSFGLGIYGAAISSAISSFFAFVVTTFYVYIHSPFKGAYKLILKIDTDPMNTSKFYICVKLGMTAGLLHFINEIRFDLIVFLSYYLDATSLVTNVILYNYINLIFHILLGFSYPISQSIRYYLCKNKYSKAILFLKGTTLIALALAAFITVISYLFKYWISWIYIKNDEVGLNFAHIINVYSFFIFFNWANGIINFTLKGINKDKNINIIFCVSIFLIFLPLAVFFAFVMKIGYAAFWYTTFASMVFYFVIQVYYINYLNIEKNMSKIVRDIQNMIEDEDIFFK
jgi:Na+-driven multidrug efflux pump